jgi:MraZ protein
MLFAVRGEKNRFVLPASLRKTVIASSGNERLLGLTTHHAWNCLSGFGLSRADTFDALIEKESARHIAAGKEFDVEGYAHSLNGFAEVPFDPSGRFVMPEYLAEVARIEDEMFLHGAGDHFTLWAPEALYEMGSMFDGAKAACRRMQADARAGKKK